MRFSAIRFGLLSTVFVGSAATTPNAAGSVQHQGPGHIGHAVVQDIRGGTDLDAALLGGLYVDGVVAYPDAANRF